MELDLVRKHLDFYDDVIKNMISLRMSFMPIVAHIKIKNNMPLFQEKRENEIYESMDIFAEKSGVDSDLIKDIYRLIMTNALKLQESIIEEETEIKKNGDFSNLEPIKKNFEKLDAILEKELPEIMLDIRKECDLKNINLTQVATWYYQDKIHL